MARRRSGSSATQPRRRQRYALDGKASHTAAAVGGTAAATATAAPGDDPQALVVSYGFDSGEVGEPYDAIVRLAGKRIGVSGLPRRGDTFSQDETIAGVIPGSGLVSLTATVHGVTAGEWSVDARLIRGPGSDRRSGRHGPGSSPAVERATWSWRRWRLSSAPSTAVSTRWALLAPLAQQPAVIPGVYTALALIGFVVALAVQGWILGGQGLPVAPPLAASLIAIAAGLVGAKAWYRVLHPDEPLLAGGGWAVDGFLVVFPLAGTLTLYAWDLPIGQIFDAATPGIFFAVAIGRIGCFLTGCCAGRCTAARWGIWSSDRRIGARRIPAQLLESGVGLALALMTLAVVLAGGLPIAGALFVVAFAVYAAVRQVLLRLRAERRRESRTLPLTAAAAGLVAVVVVAFAIAQSA